MKSFLMLLMAAAVSVGCSSPPPTDDPALRSQLTQSKVDINKVPADQKAMVQGYIDRANKMRAQAQAHAGGGQSPPPIGQG